MVYDTIITWKARYIASFSAALRRPCPLRYNGHRTYKEKERKAMDLQFQVFDMEHPNDAPRLIELKDLADEAYRLQFMVDVKDSHITKEMEISKSAGELVGRLYTALRPLYLGAPQLSEAQATEYLNKLCVRLVFCLYAEDAGIFGRRNMFHDYLDDYRPQHFAKALSDLFQVLDQEPAARDPFLEAGLAAFPYVNGGLFAESVPVPPMNDAVRRLILEDACNFDWSQISPTIFGAIFESTLNPATRRAGGMHYTSIENIHKVIDPLFLDAYKEEFHAAMQEKTIKARTEKLQALQQKLAAIRCFDPACGSGNFLTESYLSLRRLENDILRETVLDKAGSGVLGFDEAAYSPIKVSIQQFYSIEINDFAVSVAKTAIWIAESQMMQETEGIVHREMNFLHRAPRYCLWLVHAEPALLKRCPRVLERVEAVRAFRLDSKKPAPRRKAETPMLFDEVRECTSNYVAIPKVSSENRRYIPMDYLPKEIIPGDNLFMLQDATLYHFGILMSNVHMAWMRAVAGRMKSDYRYSTSIVYNNFPWPTPTPEQTAAIKKTAQAILDARELYPDSSLADLYDEVLMPKELREAHRANDRAVMRAYGFPIKMTEADCVAALMQRYEQLTAGK